MSLTETLDKLEEIIKRWPDLVESRIKGTPRPKAPGNLLSHGGHARMDELRREDIANADDRAPGASIAPLHVDVLDLMSTILMRADMLHEHVAQTVGHPRLASPASAYVDARPYLRYVLELLPEACETDDEMLEAATEKVELIHDEIMMALGEVRDGQRLNAVCPFCVGQTAKRLAGELTMRVRIRDIGTEDNPDLAEFLVVCENPDGMCRPFAREFDVWFGDNPAWRFPRWAWLAKQLHPARRAG